MKKIVIYGLGNMGQGIAKHLIQIQEELNIYIVALMDKKMMDKVIDFEVLTPNHLEEFQYDNILVTSEKWFADISDELVNKYGVMREKIIHLQDLVSAGKYYCNLCGKHVPFMLDTGIDSPVFSKRKIIGGGKRENCICPLCGGGDRERWLRYVLANKTKIYDIEASVLHFAPERQIEKTLRNNEKLTYITADIEEGRADRVEDITHISYPDGYFDYIICNHILEHIKDEKSALRELKRCIKETGKVIFSVPICWEIDTFEDDSIVSNEERLREYGQVDHVRLYGKDLKTRLENYGFHVELYQVANIISKGLIEEMRLISNDSIWILTLQ